MADHGKDVFHHIRDSRFFELPEFLGGPTAELPTLHLGFYDLPLTKFMVLEVVAGLLTLFIFVGLSLHIRGGRRARGAFWNFWEMLALFLRDEVARPAIGAGHHDHPHDHSDDPLESHGPHGEDHESIDLAALPRNGEIEHHNPAHRNPIMGEHPADRYLPYIWSCFFFVLFANLLGAIPWLGSATGHISVTAALAIVTLVMVIISGTRQLGVLGYWKALVPHMELPGWIAPVLLPLVWGIEFVGLIIKHGVLAVRLFANIMAGHTVIAVILGFIAAVAASPVLWGLVTPASVLGQVGIGLLELFVAFLQAYIFAFLSALFIGAAVHPH